MNDFYINIMKRVFSFKKNMLDLVRGKNIQELMETCKKGKKNGNKTKVVAE